MTVDDRHVRPFAEFLQEQRSGIAHAELSEAFNELIEAVRETGKTGSLTLTIRLKPAGKGEGQTVFVGDEVKVKAPELDKGEALFFIDSDCNLTRRNPLQQELPLREVPKPKTEPKEAEHA